MGRSRVCSPHRIAGADLVASGPVLTSVRSPCQNIQEHHIPTPCAPGSNNRIGRLKATSSGAGQHYHIEVDTKGRKATAIRWEQRPVAGSKLTHPGSVLPAQQSDRLVA